MAFRMRGEPLRPLVGARGSSLELNGMAADYQAFERGQRVQGSRPSGPGPCAASCCASMARSAIRAPRRSSFCLPRRNCAPQTRASPPRFTTAISALPAGSPSSTRQSPFEIEPPSEAWARELYGFGWLRHLRAAGSELSREQAKALVERFVRLRRSITRHCLAAGDRRPPGHLLAVELGRSSSKRRAALLRGVPARADRAAPLSLGELSRRAGRRAAPRHR